MTPRRHYLLSVALLGLVSGCEQQTSVSGSATYNGQPIEFGYMTFHAQSKGKSFSAPISNGAYRASQAFPGVYRAIVTGSRKIDHYSSSAEAYANAPKGGQHVSEETSYIDVDAEGNNRECEVKPGAQDLNFAVVGKPKLK